MDSIKTQPVEQLNWPKVWASKIHVWSRDRSISKDQTLASPGVWRDKMLGFKQSILDDWLSILYIFILSLFTFFPLEAVQVIIISAKWIYNPLNSTSQSYLQWEKEVTSIFNDLPRDLPAPPWCLGVSPNFFEECLRSQVGRDLFNWWLYVWFITQSWTFLLEIS